MFDYHMHSTLSHDGHNTPLEMAQAALDAGLKEICFTDHFDFKFEPGEVADVWPAKKYHQTYDNVALPGLSIKRGVEFGLTSWNIPELRKMAQEIPFDFIIGSVHFADGYDPYNPLYWVNKTVEQGFQVYLEETLRCVKIHEDYDVLGHLTYVCKSVHNPSHAPVPFADYRDLTDEIMKILVSKGKGMEINTSGVDRAGAFLPSADFLRRFKELGGEIVTVGTDAHDCSRVGQYVPQALEMIKDVFGYVCTYENRKPIFHKL